MYKKPIFILFLICLIYTNCSVNPESGPPPLTETELNINQEIPKYLNEDYLYLSGNLRGGYTHIVAEVEGQVYKEEFRDSTFFRVEVFPVQNQVNYITLFALDKFERSSDTLSFSIIHDNIPPKIVGSSVIEDSLSYPLTNPISIDYDSEIKEYSIYLGGEIVAEIEFSPKLIGNSKTLLQEEVYLHLGTDYILTSVVTDSADNESIEQIPFKTYKKRLQLGFENLKDYDFSIDKSKLLLLTGSELTVYDAATLDVMRTINLPGGAIKMGVNPVNGFVYITSRDIKVFDLETGNLVDTIEPDIPEGRTPRFWEIDFDDQGKGYFSPIQNELHIIDTRDGNSIIKFQDLNSTPVPLSYLDYQSVFIANMEWSEGETYHRFYSNSISTEINEDGFDRILYQKGHEELDIITTVVGQNYYLIKNKQEVYGPLSTVSTGPLFDYIYKEGYEDYLFYVTDLNDEFGIYNLNSGEIKKKFISSDGLTREGVITSSEYDLIYILSTEDILLVDYRTVLSYE